MQNASRERRVIERSRLLAALFSLLATVGCGEAVRTPQSVAGSPADRPAAQRQEKSEASTDRVRPLRDPADDSASTVTFPGLTAERNLSRADLKTLSTGATWQQIEASFGGGVHLEGGVLAYPVAHEPAMFLFWFRHAESGDPRLTFVTRELETDPLKALRGKVVWPPGFENQTVIEAFERPPAR